MVKVSLIEEGDPVRVPSRSIPSQISPDFGAFLGNNNQLLCRNGEERGAYSEWVSELEFRLGACAPHPLLCTQPFRGQTLASQSQFNPGALPLNCTDTWASDSPLSSIRKGKCSLLSRSIQIVVRQAGFLQIKWVLEILLLCLNLRECVSTLGLLVPLHVAVSQTSHMRRVENTPCEYRKSSRPHIPLDCKRQDRHCVDFLHCHALRAWQSARHIAFMNKGLSCPSSSSFSFFPRPPHAVTSTEIPIPRITCLNTLNGSPCHLMGGHIGRPSWGELSRPFWPHLLLLP